MAKPDATINFDLRRLKTSVDENPVEVKRQILRLGHNLRKRVRKNIPVRTRKLRESVRLETTGTGYETAVKIIASTPYARFVHEGTGIFGPLKRPITPVRARFLRFEINGQVFFRRSVKGQRPNPYMKKTFDQEGQLAIREVFK